MNEASGLNRAIAGLVSRENARYGTPYTVEIGPAFGTPDRSYVEIRNMYTGRVSPRRTIRGKITQPMQTFILPH